MLSYFLIDIYDSHQARKIKEIYNYFIAIILITIISQHYLTFQVQKRQGNQITQELICLQA